MSITEAKNSSDLSTKIITQDILSRSGTQPIYLSSVEVLGGEAFSNVFFKKLLSPLVDESDYTLTQLIENINISYEKLIKTDVFRNVGVSLHSDYTASVPNDITKYNKDKSLPTKIVFDLKSVDLNTGEGFFNLNNEDNLNVNLNYLNNNFNGNAELVNFGVNYNPYKPNEHLVANAKFLANLNNPSFKFLIDLFNTHQNNQSWQQSSERTTGGLIGLQYNLRNLSVLTGVSLAKKTIYDIDDAAADELKFFAGDYLKSSIVNQLVYSRLSYLNQITKNFPTDGYNIEVSNEISSNQEQVNPNNQAVFAKSTFSINLFKSFFNNTITTHLSNDFGGIFTPNPSTPLHISDRFYLGGTNSFKGFSKNSLNVHGGLQFYKLEATIFAKFPSCIYSPQKNAATNTSNLEDDFCYEANPLRLYGTALIGNVSDNILENKSVATSVGFGLKYINNWANFDIGYIVSRRFGTDSSNIGIKDGLQFSVSIGGSNRTL